MSSSRQEKFINQQTCELNQALNTKEIALNAALMKNSDALTARLGSSKCNLETQSLVDSMNNKHYNKSRLFAPQSVRATIDTPANELVLPSVTMPTLPLVPKSNTELMATLLVKNLTFSITTNGPDTRFSHFTNLLLRSENRDTLIDSIISECETAKAGGKVKDINSYEVRIQKLEAIKTSQLVAQNYFKN